MERSMYIKKSYKMEDNVLPLANKFIHSYYGQFLYTSKIDNSGFILNASIPYELIDGSDKKLRFDNFNNLAEIQIEKKESKIVFNGLSRENIRNTVRKRQDENLIKSEKILFQISKAKFSKIPEANVFFKPIKEIILELNRHSTLKISNEKSGTKIVKYAKFLESLGIVNINSHDNSYYISIGNEYKLIERSSSNVASDVFDYVLDRGYDYLSQTMGIRSLNPYIKVANSLYYNILRLKNNVKVDIRDLNTFYNMIYNKKTDPYKFDLYVETLSQVKILSRNNDEVSGDKEITEKIIEAPN